MARQVDEGFRSLDLQLVVFAQDGRMSQCDAAFGHHLDEVTRAELKCQIPPDAQDNNFFVKMPTLEEILRRNGVRHLRPLSPCTDLFKRLHQNLAALRGAPCQAQPRSCRSLRHGLRAVRAKRT